MLKTARGRTLLIALLMMIGLVGVASQSPKAASAACAITTTTLAPTTTTTPTATFSFTGYLNGLPYADDNCQIFNGSEFNGCDSGSTASPNVATAYVASVTATNTVTHQVLTATVNSDIAQGEPCASYCGQSASSWSGYGSFTFANFSAGSWTFTVTYNRAGAGNDPNNIPSDYIAMSTYNYTVDNSPISLTHAAVPNNCGDLSSTSSPATIASADTRLAVNIHSITENAC
jgi:hypothetical protein